MVGTVDIGGVNYSFDLSSGIDITIPFMNGGAGPNCFYAPLFEAAPLKSGDFIGSTDKGSPVNFYNVSINPHGNGTHTECVGHILSGDYFIKDVCPVNPVSAQLVTLYPQRLDNGDLVIVKDQIESLDVHNGVSALVLRTMPNHMDKKSRMYSGTNPPYIDHEAIKAIVDLGIDHLIVDLPSVDREEDEGKILGHKAFWGVGGQIDIKKTITELVFIDNVIKDGLFLCSISAVPFELDAAPSRLVLFPMISRDE